MPTNKKYGKLKPKLDKRTLRFSKYLTPALPVPPTEFAWLPQTEYGSMLNNNIGCCTISATGHAIQVWTKFAFDYYTPPDSDILLGYEAVTGIEGAAYNPVTLANDNGCNMLDVLNYWRNTGISGHKISGYASLNVGNLAEMRASIMLFLGIYTGINVPTYLENIFEDNSIVWDVAKSGDDTTSAGGHCIWILKYNDKQQLVWFVSWGLIFKMTYALLLELVDEWYAVDSSDFFKNGKTPLGYDVVAMQSDLNVIVNT